jgi:hypothetical protein
MASPNGAAGQAEYTPSQTRITLPDVTHPIPIERKSQMNIVRMMAIAVSSITLSTTALAAPPELVGTYAGTAKIKKSGISGKSTVKLDVGLIIGADDTTTITLNGVQQITPLSSSIFTTPADVALIYADPLNPADSINVVTLNVKKTTLVGTSTGAVIGPGLPPGLVSAEEGKWKLKKQP